MRPQWAPSSGWSSLLRATAHERGRRHPRRPGLAEPLPACDTARRPDLHIRHDAAPECYGKWKTLCQRFRYWLKSGVCEHVFADLLDEPDNGHVTLGNMLVRAHQQAATGKGRPDPGSGTFPVRLITKNMAVDGRGRPLRLVLTPGERDDGTQAAGLLKGAKRVLADKSRHVAIPQTLRLL